MAFQMQEVAASRHEDGASLLQHIRIDATASIAADRAKLTLEPAFGTTTPVRRQFKVSFIQGLKRPRTATSSGVRPHETAVSEPSTTVERSSEHRLVESFVPSDTAMAELSHENSSAAQVAGTCAVAASCPVELSSGNPTGVQRTSEASTTARLLGNSSLAAVADFTAAPGPIEVRLSSEGLSIVQVPDSRAAPERCPLVLSSENPTAAERISAASTTARLLGNSSLVAVADASAAPARVEAGLSCENSSSTQSIQPTEAVPSAARVWAMTLRCKYLHCLDIKAEGIFTACKWRKGAQARKPINQDRILRQGDLSGARAMRIQFCPDQACQP